MNAKQPLPRLSLAALHLAAAFLTRLPWPDPPYGPGGLAPAMAAFAPVGAGIGAAAGLVFLAAHAMLPPLAASGLALLAAALLTGGLHEDGLADFADGLGARGGIARRLEVMRDSHIGAFGALALLFAVLLRASALAAAPSGLAGLGALAAAGALSRTAIPAILQILPPARPDGLGAAAGIPDASTAALAVVLAGLVALAGLGPKGALTAVMVAALAAGLVAWLARRTLGGFTGDVLGAVVQAAETAVLLAAAAAWS